MKNSNFVFGQNVRKTRHWTWPNDAGQDVKIGSQTGSTRVFYSSNSGIQIRRLNSRSFRLRRGDVPKTSVSHTPERHSFLVMAVSFTSQLPWCVIVFAVCVVRRFIRRPPLTDHTLYCSSHWGSYIRRLRTLLLVKHTFSRSVCLCCAWQPWAIDWMPFVVVVACEIEAETNLLCGTNETRPQVVPSWQNDGWLVVFWPNAAGNRFNGIYIHIHVIGEYILLVGIDSD